MKRLLLTIFLILALVDNSQAGTFAQFDELLLGGGGGYSSYTGVVTLFGSGTCSGYLKSDGTCDSPSGTGTVTSSGTPTIHQWPNWTTATNLKGITVTSSSPVCTGATGEPVACAGTEGVWQVAGSYQANLGLIAGTLTNGYLCTYTSSGTLLACNTNPATYQTALTNPLVLGGSYTPTGTWTWSSATWVGVPTLNQSTSGTAAKATNLVGGNSTTLLGAVPYQSGTDTTAFKVNTSATRKFFREIGDGTSGGVPDWDTLQSGDIPSNAANTSGKATTAGTADIATNLAANGAIGGSYQLTDGSTIAVNWNNGASQYVTIASTGRTVTFANPVAGNVYRLTIIQDGTGSRTITTWPTIKWYGGAAPTLSTAAGYYDSVTCHYINSVYLCSAAVGFY